MTAERKPTLTCIACGRTGKRGFMVIGGFWADRLGEWWRARRIPAMFVCSSRLACTQRQFGRGYTRLSFGETWEPWESQPGWLQTEAERDAAFRAALSHHDEVRG